MSSPAVTTVNRGSMVAPFSGLKSMAGFPVRKTKYDITSIASNTGRVWPRIGKKKFETPSYLPPLTREQLLKEDGWIPCLEFELERVLEPIIVSHVTYYIFLSSYKVGR
ncbi:Ribulose bisphosphate carboxylase small chain 1, chloroplastic [Glycine soja]